MRGISVGVMAAVLTLGAAFGDPPVKEQPFSVPLKPGGGTQLDDLLARAVANSPDVQVAEAKLREAEAEVRRSRMSLIQKIIDLQSTIEIQKQQVAFADGALAKAIKMRQTGAGSDDDFRAATKQLVDSKAILARGESQLAMLCGHGPEWRLIPLGNPSGGGGPGGGSGHADAESDGRLVRPPSAAMAEKIRKALDTPVRAGDMKETPLGDVLNFYRDLSKEVPIVIAIGERTGDPISLNLNKELPLGSHLQALQDLAPGLVVSVRDYGILVTYNNQPDDAISFLDFWHGKAKRETPK